MHGPSLESSHLQDIEGISLKGRGWGRGTYGNVEGDLPICLQPQEQDRRNEGQSAELRGVKTRPNSHAQAAVTESSKIRILTKNVFSIQTEERLQELMGELRLIEWDVVVLTETWRATREENFIFADGHQFLGSGGTVGERGVAVIVHRRWRERFHSNKAISERLMAVEIDILEHKFTVIGTYMPHTGYDDREVERVNDSMSELREKVKRKGRTTIIAVDWNAVPGFCKPCDDEKVLGKHGFGPRSCRGEWMLRWATLEILCIVNTLFDKPFANKWTFIKGGRQRQLDFICIDQAARHFITDAMSTDV